MCSSVPAVTDGTLVGRNALPFMLRRAKLWKAIESGANSVQKDVQNAMKPSVSAATPSSPNPYAAMVLPECFQAS